MIQRLFAAAILIPLVLLIIFYSPPWLFLLVVELFLLVSLWELSRLAARHGAASYAVTYPLVALLPWVWAYRSGWVVPFTLLGGFLILAWGVLESMRGSMEVGRGFPSASANLMAVFYLGWPFSILTVYHPLHDPALYDRNRPLELVLVLVTLWVSDSGAYFVGRAWGRHKVTPLISPNKSLEGYLSGLLLSLLAATLYGRYFFPSWPLLRLPALALVICLAGFLGDLFESLLKRGARVNDSSHLLPGHGGILDRVDSLLFALPAYYLFSILII